METKRIGGYYIKDEKHYPSVTKVAGCVSEPTGLMRWHTSQGAYALYNAFRDGIDIQTPDHAKEIAIAGAESERMRTATFGSDSHLLLELYLLNKPVPEDVLYRVDKRVIQVRDTFHEFYKLQSMNNLYVETEVFNVAGKYAGRLDAVSEVIDSSMIKPFLKRGASTPINGLKYVVDFKTGSYDKQSHGVQLSAYMKAVNETLGVECEGGMVFHIERDNPEKLSIQVFNNDEMNMYYEQFKVAHKAWETFLAPKWWKEEHYGK